jgi:hypothetical protein
MANNTEEELWLQELEQPAIPFHKVEDHEAQTTLEKDESQYFQVNTSLANTQAEGTDILKKDLCIHSILKYQGGTPEQYCKWRQAMKNLFAKRGCSDAATNHAQQLKLYRGALDGIALEAFNAAYDLREEEDGNRQQADPNDPQRGAAVVLAQALNDMALQAFDGREDAAITQRHYLTHHIPIKPMDIRQWSDRLRELSNWLKYFPITTEAIRDVQPATFPQTLTDAEMMSMLRASAPPTWQAKILAAGGPTSFATFAKMKARYQALQQADKIEQSVQARKESSNGSQQNGNNHRQKNGKTKFRKSKKKYSKGGEPQDDHDDSSRGTCERCGRRHPNPGDGCWTLEKNKHLRPQRQERDGPKKKVKVDPRHRSSPERDKPLEQSHVMLTIAQYESLRNRHHRARSVDSDDSYMEALRKSTSSAP